MSPELFFPAFVSLLTVFLVYAQSIYVGAARRKYKIVPPHTTGNLDFERVFRVHYNTLEQLPIFMIPLWIFALTVSSYWAGWLGLAWLVGRVAYMYGYYKTAKTRHNALSAISYLAGAILIVGSLLGILPGLL